METIESLILKGYRVYHGNKIPRGMRNYLKARKGIAVDYHEDLKVIIVKDAKSQSRI